MAEAPDLEALESAVAAAVARIAELHKENGKLSKRLAAAKKATKEDASAAPDPRSGEIRERLGRLDGELGSLLEERSQ